MWFAAQDYYAGEHSDSTSSEGDTDEPTDNPTDSPTHTALSTDRVSWDKLEHIQPGANFDTNGIPFVIDNSATCIICNNRSQFVGPLERQDCQVETSVGKGRCECIVYDPSSPFNILGVPYLGDFFGMKDDIPSSDDDGTFIISSANKSHFVWDHGQQALAVCQN